MANLLPNPPIFLDFEASSLAQNSNPIEVGLTSIEGGNLHTWSSLICPDPSWAEDWSLQSAQIHGLSQHDLGDAPPAAEVAQDVLKRIRDRTLISDAPEFDQRWLDRLLGVLDRDGSAPIQEFDTACHAFFDDRELDHLYEFLKRRRSKHRAGSDSARLAASWLHALSRRSA